MPRRHAGLSLGLLMLGFMAPALAPSAQAAPLAALNLGVIPASGPPGMSVTVVGSGSWTMAPSNPPYIVFWESAGGTQLGGFSPDGSGSWSTSVTIPMSASAGAHTIVACEGYGIEFQQCASTTFTASPATNTPSRTPTRTPSRTPTASPPGYVPPTSTHTPTYPYDRGCMDGLLRIAPTNSENLGGVAVADLVLEVVMTDPSTARVLVYRPRSDEIYTQWPDPLPGTTVEAVPDPVEANRWRLTVRDFPIPLGPQYIEVELNPTCLTPLSSLRLIYYQFGNGLAPTGTPRPDACGGLGLPPEATVINFDWASAVERAERDQGVRFDGSLRAVDPRNDILPRSGSYAGASIEGMEFGSVMLPIRMAFDRPLQALGLFVGLEEAIYVSGEITASLSAYGYHPGSAELVLLGSDATSFPAEPTDIRYCLRFEAAEGDIIARAQVEYTDAGGGSIAERRVIDDLTLLFAEAELPPDAPPVVEITSPSDGASVPSTTVYLRANIWEDRELGEVRYQIDGGSETAIGAAPLVGDPMNYFTGVNFSASILTPGVPHLLTVTAFDRAGRFASDSVSIIIPTPAPTVDVQAVKMEVVQVVQCLDNTHCVDNAVPMVRGKPAWARIYVRSEGGAPARPISGRLCQGRVGTCTTAYLNPLNTIVPDGDEDPVRSDRGNLDATLNFILPPAWLLGDTLELTAFVNYDEEDVDEIRIDNNSVQAALDVEPPRNLAVMFMPTMADGFTAPISEMWPLADRLTRLFPVSRITVVARGPLPGNFDLSDSSGGNCGRTWNRLMDALRAAYIWRGPGTAYLYGMVPPEANTDGVGGCGETPGRVASGLITPGWTEQVRIAGQELGHTFGRNHASAGCDAGNPDRSYPRRNGLLDDWGLDVVARHPYPMNESYDYMSYCAGADNHWTSVYTYLALLGTLPVAAAAPSGAHLASLASAEGEPVLVGGGQISPEGFILEHGFYRAGLAEGVDDSLPPGPYEAQLRDGSDGILFAREFGLIEMSNAEPTDEGTFQIILPDVPGTKDIVFLYQGVEIGRVSASANAPQVSIVEPAGGEDWGASGAHTIAWEASDADGDGLRFNVQYSPDGGGSWSSIETDVAGSTSLTVDSADLPGGEILFRVLASDGLNTTESATTSPVTVADKQPLIHIATPSEGDVYPVGEAVILTGYAADFEDVVLPDDAYRWTSSVDGELGTGPTLWGIPLSPGAHEITLVVTDSSGQAVGQSLHITVGGQGPGAAPRPPLAMLLLIAGGVLLLGSAAGIAFFFMRARKA